MMIQTVDILSTAKQFLVSSTSIILLQGKISPSLHFFFGRLEKGGGKCQGVLCSKFLTAVKEISS